MKSMHLLALLALCACLASPFAAAQARRAPVVRKGPAGGENLEAAIARARVGGKYQGLLRVLWVEQDVATYGRFKDYGLWQGSTYRGHRKLPTGYWVWVAPHWFIWARQSGAAPAGRVLQPSAPTAKTNRIRTSVEDALDWLARFQTRTEGYWDADGFHRNVKGATAEGLGYPLYDHGLTGLALLAFFGAGHTHTQGNYKEQISDALKYLKRIQDPEGCFGAQTGHFMYNHAICTLAVIEAYGMTRSPLLRRPAEKAVAFLLKAQNPNPSGSGKLAWRYTVKPGDNDSSVTAWAVMALKSAKTAGLQVDYDTAFNGARTWLEQMTDPVTGRVGYVQAGVSPVRAPGREVKWPRGKSEAITAAGLITRIFLGEHPDRSKVIDKGVTLLMDRLPEWNPEAGTIDPYYWYYGTLATFQVGGHAWKRWSMALREAVEKNQRTEGPHKGSWDPLGPWGADGGRVYTTALLAMCLEVQYRYARVAGVKKL